MKPISERLEELQPDPEARQRSARAVVESMNFIRQRRPDWALVRLEGRRLRLFTGGLIVMTLHPDRIWMAVSDSAAGLDELNSWEWDEESYPRFRRVPSRNGFYRPQADTGGDWPRIQQMHFAFLDDAAKPGVSPGPASLRRHDEALAIHLDALARIGADSGSVPPTDHDMVAIEGQPRLVSHLRRERDPSLARAKRDAVLRAQGRLTCEVCGFDTEKAFPALGKDICEVHHRRPLSESDQGREVGLDDLAILCPNCHRAIHLTNPLCLVEEFREAYVDAAGPAG